MSISNGYTTLAALKARASIEDTRDDLTLETIITAVSRMIDNYCGRRFYAATETRYYTARDPYCLLVDDLLSVSALVTDEDGDRTYETTWASTDYDLYPDNAALEAQPEPFWKILVAPEGNYTFPVGVRRGVKVTGSWGFASSTPPVVGEACLLQAARIFARREAPMGVLGAGEAGGTVRIAWSGLDPDVRRLLDPLRRLSVG